MTGNSAIVRVFDSHAEAEASIKDAPVTPLRHEEDYHIEENIVGFYNVGDRMKVCSRSGAFRGGFWGLLFDSAMFVIPGLGHLVAFGPMVDWIVGDQGERAGVDSSPALRSWRDWRLALTLDDSTGGRVWRPPPRQDDLELTAAIGRFSQSDRAAMVLGDAFRNG